MAASQAHGRIDWAAADAVSSTKVVTGLGFQPKFVLLWQVGIASTTDASSTSAHERRNIGMLAGSSQVCVGTRSSDAVGSSVCGNTVHDDCCVITHSGAGASDGELTGAIDSDGFTLTVVDAAPADITIFWWALGGNFTCGLGTFTEPAATGDQSYTATGFVNGGTDQAVIIAFSQRTGAINSDSTNQDSGLSLGFGDGTTSVMIAANCDQASGTQDTDGGCRGDNILGLCANGGGSSYNSLASLTGFGTDTFTLNWSATANTARKGIYGYIKGESVKVGAFTINSDTIGNTATVSSLAFAPKGVLLISTMQPEATTLVAHSRWGIGYGSSTSSRRAMAVIDVNGLATASEIGTAIEYDEIMIGYANTTTVDALYDLNAMNSDGFQLIVDDAAGAITTTWFGYFTFGDAPAAGPAGRPRLTLMGVGR